MEQDEKCEHFYNGSMCVPMSNLSRKLLFVSLHMSCMMRDSSFEFCDNRSSTDSRPSRLASLSDVVRHIIVARVVRCVRRLLVFRSTFSLKVLRLGQAAHSHQFAFSATYSFQAPAPD